MTIYLVENDTKPLDVTLDVDGDIAGADVTLHLAQRHGTKTVAGVCTIVSAPAQSVRYEWEPDDLDTPGVYDAEWQIVYDPGSEIESAPNRHTEIIQVREQVA